MAKVVSPKDDNVKVVVRVRPMSATELKNNHKSIVKMDTIAGSVVVSAEGQPPKTFTFDSVFDPTLTQMHIYNTAARPIVDNVLEGYNGTIFAYGQTGTGKTYTMEGNRAVPEEKGIIPNSFAHIFDKISKVDDDIRFLVRVSYLEIYNEEIRDLLSKNHTQRLEVKERPDIGVYVKDLSTVTVSCADEMDKIMTLGNKNRSVGATAMNETSSRSHAIFTVTIECSEIGVDKQRHFRQGKLHLVDLAGSERQSKTHSSGLRLKEAGKINLSLSTLGNVISALVDAKSTFIPYRNSNLTRLLQDSLGGNSKTVMCANIGPASYNCDETISTLRYANRAKNIKNAAHINEDPKDALLRKYQEEIEALKRQLGDEGGEYESGSGEETGDEAADGEGGRRRRKRLNSAQMSTIEAQIEADRSILLSVKDMAAEERTKIEKELQGKEDDLAHARSAHELLQQKLAQIEKRVIVGGENLLEKAEEQARLLNANNEELEKRRTNEFEMREALQKMEAERIDIEEKYKSLDDEARGKTKKLKKVWTMLMSAKSEMTDIEAEHQREMEGLLDSVRELSKELRLQMLLIDQFIPKHYQELIERYVHWNDEIGDWELKCIAYTGNNMRKQTDEEENKVEETLKNNYIPPDLSSIYLSYAKDVGGKRGIALAAKAEMNAGQSAMSRSTRQRLAHKKREKKEAKHRNLLY